MKEKNIVDSIKTRYMFIEFNEILENVQWMCVNRKEQDMLGVVSYYPRWRQWVFEPERYCQFSVDCMQDIIHFINQLPKG